MRFAEKMVMSTSPHITSKDSTTRIMGDVCIALMPACLVGIILFGIYALVNIVLCVGFCVLFEYAYCKISKKQSTISDLSAVVTGLILAMCLPAGVPFYIPLIGSLYAIGIIKMLFGGLGKNFANPAAAARVFLLLSFSGVMTRFFAPVDYSNGIMAFFNFDLFLLTPANASTSVVDSVMTATPLAREVSLTSLFLGNVSGSFGETSKIALLIGGIYLCLRKVIDWRIPATCLASVMLFAFLFTSGSVTQRFLEVPYFVLSGGIVFGAIFMITDYSSSPNGMIAQIIFAIIIGFFAVVIRIFSSMPEGMSFAILIGNLVAPLLDKYLIPKPFGWKKRRKQNE